MNLRCRILGHRLVSGRRSYDGALVTWCTAPRLPVPRGRTAGPVTAVPVTIRDVWALIPDLDCRGLCLPSCSGISMTEAEMKLVRERLPSFPDTIESAERMATDDDYRCPALVFGRCIIYPVRPTVCRLWGVDERMPCPHGCVPRGGHLPKERGSAIMDAARQVGGDPV